MAGPVPRALARAAQTGATKKPKLPPPNYFVAVPISNFDIRASFTSLQNAVVQADERLRPALVSVAKLHITLMVMHLKNDEELDRARRAMDVARRSVITELVAGLKSQLVFRGTGHFRDQVMFVKPAEGDGLDYLHAMAQVAARSFAGHGLVTSGGKNFTPHLTVMKLSKAPKLRHLKIKKIDPALYADYRDHEFGSEVFDRIQLCSMVKKAHPETGYYHCEHEVHLRDDNYPEGTGKFSGDDKGRGDGD